MQNGITVIITGCGFKPIEHLYTHNGKPTHAGISIDGKQCKMNIGTAIAYYFARKNIKVIMVSRTKENLEKIKQGLIELGCNSKYIEHIASDITSDAGIEILIKNLPKDTTFYRVQSLGMGGGTYKVPNDNIYLPFEKISPELISAEMDIVAATHKLMLKLVPIFKKQIKAKQQAKIAMITSMSGERGYYFGTTHVAAKHAFVGYIKGIEKELEAENIEIHDIRPGAIDTGMYDNVYVRNAVQEISKKSKMWGGKPPIYRSPLDVAKKVYLSLFGKHPQKIYRILAPHQK